MNRVSPRVVLLGALVFAALVGAAALLPTEVKFHLHTQGALHPWIHVVVFGVLAAVCLSVVSRWRDRVLLLLGNVAFAWSTEFVESLRNGWPVERRDGVLDMVGIAAAFAFVSLWQARSAGRRSVDFPHPRA